MRRGRAGAARAVAEVPGVGERVAVGVRRGRVDVDGEARELGEGGLFHASATTPRRISNAGDEDAVVFVVGGKGGYVERDGHLVNPEVDLPRRQGLS